MIEPDLHSRRVVARDRQARLAADGSNAGSPRLDVKQAQVEASRPPRLLGRVRVQLRPAR